MECVIPGCGRTSRAYGMCRGHAGRVERGVDPLPALGRYVRGSLYERVAHFTPHEDVGSCWVWGGSIGKRGYGVIDSSGKRLYAHRVVFEMTRGGIPDTPGADSAHGTVIMHTCDNRACVNPGHLRAGTQRENLRDMASKGRGTKPLKDTCPYGHFYGLGNGTKGCPVCAHERKRAKRHQVWAREIIQQ